VRSIDRRSLARDAAAAVVMVLLSLLTLMVSYDALEAADQLDEASSPAVGVLMVLVLMAPLAWRRVFPTTVVVVATVAFSVFRVLEVPEGAISSLALFLAIYTVGAWAHTPRRRLGGRLFAIVVSMCVVFWHLVYRADYVDVDAFLTTTLTVTINGAFFVTAWMMGDLARVRKENELELAHRAEQLAAEREERSRRAVMDERVRIARELHDVVAHHVSVMGIQAGAARRILGSDPARAAEALTSIEESGRQAVAELQRLVGFLRAGEEPDLVEPQPGIDDIDRLVARTAAAGQPVELRRIGRARPVPPAVALNAYRIVQEALTNTMKHAGQVPTMVVLTYGADRLGVEVVNGRGQRPATAGGGRGLVGMRERAAMVGGAIEAAPTPDGGYRVSVMLPTGSVYDPAPA
jgi:signal transduction histidine kinase